MRKTLKYAGLFLLVISVALTAYATYVVVTAKNYTRTVILQDLQASQWRSPQGSPHKFEITIQDLSKQQIDILLKVQDPGFYQHRGIDLSTPGAGLTTLAQAIVKKLYFANFKSGPAKFKQSLIARYVAGAMISKEDQITLFVNMIYFGKVATRPAVGLAAAARIYYQQPVSELTEDQYISLIAMIIMPTTFHLLDHPAWNRERSRRIKELVAGKYQPRGLMDQYYGNLSPEVISAGLPAFSYFGDTDDAR